MLIAIWVTEEKALLIKVKEGDLEAFQQLIQPCELKIYNTALGIVQSHHDAEDVMQETLIKIFGNIHKFKGDSKFSTWVYTITVNTAKDHLRKKKSVVSFDPAEHQQFLEDGGPAVVDQVVAEETMDEIRSAMEQLKEEMKLPLVLRDIEELSYEEIAKILGLSLGTVKSRIFRGREKLREILVQKKVL